MTLPDFMTDPNAVLKDTEHQWRYGRIPDYTKVNKAFDAEKTMTHAEGSLEWLVSNLVKNWEKEMSYKLNADEIRTIDRKKYKFSCNGLKPQTIDEMLEVGTYNALIGDTELYKASEMDFSESHKLFKRALRTFSWEVLQVYSGPPVVAFKWRHWGTMTGNLSVKVGNGKKLEAPASNELVETFGVTVAKVNDKFEIEELETFYDPNQLIQQLAKNKDQKKEEDGAASLCPFMAANKLN
ncbi:hypothetical protein G6F46_002041 [Rhizopus delemar]|uniref:Pathogen-related protein n=3 Tax=Rhizopus TaxID=4842 RepID=I1BUE9_RHIO9|nr:hypothetical protein RO3G_04534 [Rhizopus delemar RA 99-880]KAG1466290.1 hypothetical protein G6F55_000585 [Rhizopus delemar]KAG1554168.1 hypothetical protein G6F51_000129 [Rhizopus arrhizus]KAG1503747.1 hypothetical protein G6F54_001474 [Rhizopus delemar]KAG1518686.1 hypothetical protein G6F53_000388 [Rhizopus delemar]|eukprot:EIE79829.1 hypothetical protein RO3G_04534 [Rhizopus delemar RA 99-880]